MSKLDPAGVTQPESPAAGRDCLWRAAGGSFSLRGRQARSCRIRDDSESWLSVAGPALLPTGLNQMATAEFLNALDELATQAQGAFDGAVDLEQLEAARVEFLGAKNGRLKATQKLMGTGRRRGPSGRRQTVERSQAGDRSGIHTGPAATGRRLPPPRLQASTFDPTLPGVRPRTGAPASDYADDRRADGHHGTVGLHGGRRARN